MCDVRSESYSSLGPVDSMTILVVCRMSKSESRGQTWSIHEARSFHSLWGLETENGGICRHLRTLFVQAVSQLAQVFIVFIPREHVTTAGGRKTPSGD